MINTAGRNTLITSLMVCCGFFICCSPSQILALINIITSTVDYRSWFYQFTIALIEANCCINAFIYAAKYREFQDGVRRLISILRGCHQESIQDPGLDMIEDMANFARLDCPTNSGNSGGAVGGTSGSTDTPAVTQDTCVITPVTTPV